MLSIIFIDSLIVSRWNYWTSLGINVVFSKSYTKTHDLYIMYGHHSPSYRALYSHFSSPSLYSIMWHCEDTQSFYDLGGRTYVVVKRGLLYMYTDWFFFHYILYFILYVFCFMKLEHFNYISRMTWKMLIPFKNFNHAGFCIILITQSRILEWLQICNFLLQYFVIPLGSSTFCT